MTKAELNKEFKKILKKYRLILHKKTHDEIDYGALDKVKDRLKDAYTMSDQFRNTNYRSVMIFLHINNSLRVIPFHHIRVNPKLL